MFESKKIEVEENLVIKENLEGTVKVPLIKNRNFYLNFSTMLWYSVDSINIQNH